MWQREIIIKDTHRGLYYKQEVNNLAIAAEIQAKREAAENEAKIQQIKTQAAIEALQQLEQAASAYSNHPATRMTRRESGQGGKTEPFMVRLPKNQLVQKLIFPPSESSLSPCHLVSLV